MLIYFLLFSLSAVFNQGLPLYGMTKGPVQFPGEVPVIYYLLLTMEISGPFHLQMENITFQG